MHLKVVFWFHLWMCNSTLYFVASLYGLITSMCAFFLSLKLPQAVTFFVSVSLLKHGICFWKGLWFGLLVLICMLCFVVGTDNSSLRKDCWHVW